MSLIEKKNLNYLTTVEQFFLSLRNSGLSLSASDYHLIGEWEARGIPVKDLCRAIEQGYLTRQKQVARPSRGISLTSLKNAIEKEIGRENR